MSQRPGKPSMGGRNETSNPKSMQRGKPSISGRKESSNSRCNPTSNPMSEQRESHRLAEEKSRAIRRVSSVTAQVTASLGARKVWLLGKVWIWLLDSGVGTVCWLGRHLVLERLALGRRVGSRLGCMREVRMSTHVSCVGMSMHVSCEHRVYKGTFCFVLSSSSFSLMQPLIFYSVN